MRLTQSEENYIKAIYSIQAVSDQPISTNKLAEKMDTKASSATDMIQRLSEKEIITYIKYKGCSLTEKGRTIALKTIRKHRLWETFLVEKLDFRWDEVHEIAEQLEHIQSIELTNRLEAFLDHPKFDPHGDPIPDRNGQITHREKSCKLIDLNQGDEGVIIGVEDGSTSFLQYLNKMDIQLGTTIKVLDFFEFDQSMQIMTEERAIQLSKTAITQITVQRKKTN